MLAGPIVKMKASPPARITLGALRNVEHRIIYVTLDHEPLSLFFSLVFLFIGNPQLLEHLHILPVPYRHNGDICYNSYSQTSLMNRKTAS